MGDPVLVYDDDCGFCTWWADYFAARSDIPVVGYSELTPELRARLPDDYRNCSHLLTDDGVYSCGQSIEEAFVRSDVGTHAQPVIEQLRGVGPYNSAREWGYSWVARNRGRLGRFMSKPTDGE